MQSSVEPVHCLTGQLVNKVVTSHFTLQTIDKYLTSYLLYIVPPTPTCMTLLKGWQNPHLVRDLGGTSYTFSHLFSLKMAAIAEKKKRCNPLLSIIVYFFGRVEVQGLPPHFRPKPWPLEPQNSPFTATLESQPALMLLHWSYYSTYSHNLLQRKTIQLSI